MPDPIALLFVIVFGVFLAWTLWEEWNRAN